MTRKTSMTSRERVLAAFAHEQPDRVPCWCGAAPEFWIKAKKQLKIGADEALRVRFSDDFRRVHACYTGPKRMASAGGNSVTPFGVERAGIGYGQPLSHPLACATLADIHAYAWPDPNGFDVSRIASDASQWRGQYAILGGDFSPFWHDAIDLLGMENLYLKMIEEPELVDALLLHLVDYYAALSQRIFDAAEKSIDVFFIGNDFGGQTGPLMSPQMFARFFAPHLQRLAHLGHAYGLKVQLHCCGGFAPLIPLMIAAGIDGLHAVQPCCSGMDLRRLKAEFGAQILFNGGIDSHHVLIKGTPEFVRVKTREALSIMMPGGGYVAGASHDTIMEETPVENVVAMFDAVMEYGVYA